MGLFAVISGISSIIVAILGHLTIAELRQTTDTMFEEEVEWLFEEKGIRDISELNAWYVFIPQLPVFLAYILSERFDQIAAWYMLKPLGWLAFTGTFGLNALFSYIPELKGHDTMDGINFYLEIEEGADPGSLPYSEQLDWVYQEIWWAKWYNRARIVNFVVGLVNAAFFFRPFLEYLEVAENVNAFEDWEEEEEQDVSEEDYDNNESA